MVLGLLNGKRHRKHNRNRHKGDSAGWNLSEMPWRRIVSIAGFFVLATALSYGFVLAVDRPVEKVDVSGRFQRVTPAQVERAVTVALKSGVDTAGFLSVNLADVRHQVERLPWVERARVERSWPGLRVEITEQNPIARWGESGLLNTRGEVFIRELRHIPPELPELNGPEGTEWQVAQLYLSTQGQLVEAGTRLTALTLDARGAVELKLANGIEVRFGRRQVEERIDRFVRTALPLLNPRAAEVSYVDMRYSNGFAVNWKQSKAT